MNVGGVGGLPWLTRLCSFRERRNCSSFAGLRQVIARPDQPSERHPTGIAYDKASNRLFSGCSGTFVVVDASTGKLVASIKNGSRVDAFGWDASKTLMFIPNGGEGTVTVVHQDAPDTCTVVSTVPTVAGAKTIAIDPGGCLFFHLG